MTNPSKNKGTSWETACVRYFRANGFPQAERIALAGAYDMGDIRVTSGLIAECKNHKVVTDNLIHEWQAETIAEKRNAGADKAWLIIKRAGKANVADAMCWEQNAWGYWQMMFTHEAVALARAQGWGNPL